MDKAVKDKWRRLLTGEYVVMSDEEMSQVEAIDHPRVSSLASIPNPARYGLKDRYLAYLKEEEPQVIIKLEVSI